MIVPFFGFQDLPNTILDEWIAAAERVLRNGIYIGGSEVELFEQEWSDSVGVAHCVGVANGMDAITLALKSVGISKGMKVAVPSHTFIATWLAVANLGAEPVGIDCGADGLMDLSLLIDHDLDVQCVVPVHMHGQMVDMERLMNWAQPKGIKVVEDCAQAHGAIQKGKFAGTWGDAGAFSFYPSKNLGAAGDAGAVVTSDPAIANKIRSLGNYGAELGNKYRYESLGLNSRLDPIQAAILRVNLTYLNDWNKKRKEIAHSYYNFFEEVGIRHLQVSVEDSVHHHCVLLTDDRDNVRAMLASVGVMTEVHYPESAESSYCNLAGKHRRGNLNADFISSQAISIPLTPWLTANKISQVMGALSSENILKILTGSENENQSIKN